jgi:hypothetical protein
MVVLIIRDIEVPAKVCRYRIDQDSATARRGRFGPFWPAALQRGPVLAGSITTTSGEQPLCTAPRSSRRSAPSPTVAPITQRGWRHQVCQVPDRYLGSERPHLDPAWRSRRPGRCPIYAVVMSPARCVHIVHTASMSSVTVVQDASAGTSLIDGDAKVLLRSNYTTSSSVRSDRNCSHQRGPRAAGCGSCTLTSVVRSSGLKVGVLHVEAQATSRCSRHHGVPA